MARGITLPRYRLSRRHPTHTRSRQSGSGYASAVMNTKREDEEDLSVYSERRQKRIRVVAWVTIVSLILVGGGATVLTLLFG